MKHTLVLACELADVGRWQYTLDMEALCYKGILNLDDVIFPLGTFYSIIPSVSVTDDYVVGREFGTVRAV